MLIEAPTFQAFGVFGLCQMTAFALWMKSKMTPERFNLVLRSVLLVLGGTVFLGLVVATFLHSKIIYLNPLYASLLISEIAPWTGRFYSLLDPSYAKNNIPIIASVSEHQPTAWSSFFFDLHFLVFFFPVGLYYCFKSLTDQNIFVILYGITVTNRKLFSSALFQFHSVHLLLGRDGPLDARTRTHHVCAWWNRSLWRVDSLHQGRKGDRVLY